MPANTPNQNYPYPIDTDVIDVAGDIEKLALAVDDDISDTIAIVDNKVSVSGDTMTGMLTLPGTNPTSLNHAVRKGWADTTYLNKTGDTLSGDIDMDFNRIHNLAKGQSDGDAVRLDQLINKTENLVTKNQSSAQTMEGSLAAPRFFITDDTSPDGPNQAAPKRYVDDQLGVYVKKTGGTMTGNLILGGDWESEVSAIYLDPEGRYRNTILIDQTNMVLNKSDAANTAGGVYVAYNYDVDAQHGRVSIEDDDDGSDVPGVGVEYITTSDHRLKERLEDVTDAAERVQGMAQRVYRGGKKGATRAVREMINAHDIAEFAPYAVRGEKDAVTADGKIAPQMVNYGGLVPLLIAALGNALDRIAALEAAAS